jgi:hypothetical protein
MRATMDMVSSTLRWIDLGDRLLSIARIMAGLLFAIPVAVFALPVGLLIAACVMGAALRAWHTSEA